MNRLQYLLLLAAEEGSEVAQAATKAMRFGTQEVYKVTGLSNEARLQAEFNDILAVMELLNEEGLVLYRNEDMIKEKKAKVEKFMQYSKDLGIVK